MEHQDLVIRRYADEDRDRVLDIWLAASRIGHPFLSEDELAAQRKATREIYLPMAETWIAVAQDKPVGFIGLLDNSIGGLFVDPEAQGRGIGTALVDHATKLKGTLDVEVFAENPIAPSFYRRRGFVETGRRFHGEEIRPRELIRMKQGA
jgi:ribosomal protein S18 acetylase RimI-like enzyme